VRVTLVSMSRLIELQEVDREMLGGSQSAID
jgi:hypothetical protein